MPEFKTLLQRWLRRFDVNEPVPDRQEYLLYVLIAIVISIFTFPKFFPQIQLGLDGSETFAFNYLFYHRIQFGTNIVFTYGPLGFLYSPMCIGNNLLIAILLSAAIRFIFIYIFLMLGYFVNRSHRVLHIILVIGFCNMMYIDMALIGGTILAMLIYHIRKEIIWLICGSLLTALALLIKSSCGLMCITVLLSYSVYAVVSAKRPAVILYVSLFTAFFFLFIWFLLYHNVSGILTYYRSMYEFAKDNSTAYQLEVTNHWGILFLALLFFYLPLFFAKNELTRVFYIITTAALYAAFKYSFAREENWHQLFLCTFVIMECAIFLLLNSNARVFAVMLLLASISLLYANMVMTNAYTIDDKKKITGIGNFITFVIDYHSVIKDVRLSDSLTLQSKALSGEQRAIIGTNTVDCYPMELTYVAANSLNWDPRPNLQILAYTPWLDHHNASFLSSPQAPQFYIWELEQPPVNNYSLDTHYLLNDEPKTIFSFFNHYQLINVNSHTALFKHADTNLLGNEHSIGTTIGYLDKWLDVMPSDSSSVIRAKIHFQYTFKGILRKLFYKDHLFFIDYMLENGTVKSYRFIPSNAVSGLWINPLVINVTNGLKGERVKNIRIRISRPGNVENSFIVDWTTFHIK